MIFSCSIRSLTIWGSWNYHSKLDLIHGLICKIIHFWNNWIGFLLLALGFQLTPIPIFFQWLNPHQIMCPALCPLIKQSPRAIFSGLKTIGLIYLVSLIVLPIPGIPLCLVLLLLLQS